MIVYDDNLKIKDALEVYFSKYHFKDGGYNEKWFRIKLGIIFIPLPNIPSRIRAVKLHDIHHVITGYEANYRGEAEIGGWEIASGCGKHYIAWILNFGSFLIGMLLYPKCLYQAFMRGRRVNKNLYKQQELQKELLDKTVGELREEFQIENHSKNNLYDLFLFIAAAFIALLPYIVFFCILSFLI